MANTMISRSEGYKRSAGKEELGLTVVEDFLADVFNVIPSRITGDKNYLNGDLSLDLGSIEVKSQPINPLKYPKNFVEVCEVTDSNKPHHSDGFNILCDLLKINSDFLAKSKVRDKRDIKTIQRQKLFGSPRYLSVSISTLARAQFIFYVNPSDESPFIYCYSSDWLLMEIKNAISSTGFVRGAGKSNDDTFAIFSGIKIVWEKVNEKWVFRGNKSMEKAFLTIFSKKMISG